MSPQDQHTRYLKLMKLSRRCRSLQVNFYRYKTDDNKKAMIRAQIELDNFLLSEVKRLESKQLEIQ